MQRVGSRGRARAARRARAVTVAACLSALLVLAACTAGSHGVDKNGKSQSPLAHDKSLASSSAPPVSQAVITTSPASGKSGLNPTTPVDVDIDKGTLTSVTMTNPAGKVVSGTMAGDGASWHNTEVLGYSKTYDITAKGVDGDGLTVTKTEHVTTLTPDNMTMPYINNIYGTSIDDGATYGVGMVVLVHFDERVDRAAAEKTLHVSTSPQVTGSWYWSDDQNVYWRPQHYYTPGTKVTVSAKVYGVDVGDGLYGQADQSTSFTIGAKHYSVANAATHHVKVYFGDKLVRTMPTSMGQGGTVPGDDGPVYLWTMPGVYTVINHENPATMSSDSFGLPANSPLGFAPEKVPWATKISTDGIYLHELDTTLAEQGNSNVSHGCLNLNQKNAKWFYNHSLVGDVVKVVHSGGPKIQFWEGGEWSVPWSQWLQHSALS